MRIISLLTVVLVGFLCGCSPHVDTLNLVVQYQKDTAAIKSYLTQNNIHATKLPSGVWYIIDSSSTGIRATFRDTMTLTYQMKLMNNGVIVDQTATPLSFDLSQSIQGIQAAMPYIQNGSKGRIFIPSFYAYQDKPNGNIPANSNLIFDFKLINVKDVYLKSDTAAIDNYLSSNAVPNVHKDPSGLRYTVDSTGTGPLAAPNDSISFKYGLNVFSGAQVTQYTNNIYTTSLQNLILGWQIAMPMIPEGSYAKLYVPSSLAYGPNSPAVTIPAHSILVFTVKLVKVHHH